MAFFKNDLRLPFFFPFCESYFSLSGIPSDTLPFVAFTIFSLCSCIDSPKTITFLQKYGEINAPQNFN